MDVQQDLGWLTDRPMAEYLVLARKYRSTTFDEVVGQEPIAQTLKNAISTGRIHHAYLFTGTRGVGKTTMARILAKALNCLSYDKPTITPCGKCESCEAIARGDDVDVIEMDGASNRGIDEIRELRANSIYRPARARYKIYYIDEVHQVTKDAFNALLKTLEEPPEHVKFIFATTESEKVPATILSRCQRFDFRNIPTRDIAGHLKALCTAENVQADEDALFRIARAAAGSMRDGLSLLDQLLAASAGKVTDADVVRILGTPGDERTLGIAAAVSAGDVAGALKQLDAVLESGVTLQSAVTSLGESFRNMMVASVCGASSDLIELPEQQRAALGELAKKFSLPTLVQAVGILQTLLRNIRTSSVARPLAEAAIVRLAAADKFVDPQSLLARLEALAGGAPLKKNLTENREPGFAPTGVRTDGIRVSGGGGTVSGNSAFAPRNTAAPQSPPVASGGGTAQNVSSAVNPAATPAIPNPQSATRNSSRPAFGDLSTAEKTEILKDPSVGAVTDLFGGDVVDIRRNPNATPQTEEPENG
jgi:DNA polymerase-3 subunit gamma/tau